MPRATSRKAHQKPGGSASLATRLPTEDREWAVGKLAGWQAQNR